MYRDSRLGLCIDLSGPDGNANFLITQGRAWCRQMAYDEGRFTREATSGDYNQVLATMKKYFGNVVTLLNEPTEGADDEEE